MSVLLPAPSGDKKSLNSLLWLSSKVRSSLPLKLTCGRADAFSSTYLPWTHFLYSTAFWMSRFWAAAIASACSSVSTRTTSPLGAAAADVTACASGAGVGAWANATAAVPTRIAPSATAVVATACARRLRNSHAVMSSRIV